MAVQDKMGKIHHSASRARLSDDINQRNEKVLSKPATVTKAPEDGGASQDVSHLDIKEVVKKHGPAHEVHIKHDHASGQHHVHSMHKGAHHKSTHMSADDAHMAGGAAAGLAPGEEEQPAEPYAGAETLGEEEAEEKQGGIPGMA